MEELLLSRLEASTALTALVADRIQWGRREQASILPAVTLNKVTGGPLYADEGEVGLAEHRIQIDCWGDSFASATAIARAVHAQLSGYTDANFEYISLDAERDLSEGGANQANYEYRTSMDFVILHKGT